MNLDHNRSTFFIRLFIKSLVYFPLCVIPVMLLLMFYSCFYLFCTNRLNLSNHTGSFHWSLSCFVLPIVPEWNTSPLFQNWNQICFTSLIHFWRLCSFFQHNRTPSPSLLCVCVRLCVCVHVCPPVCVHVCVLCESTREGERAVTPQPLPNPFDFTQKFIY